jgi:hypothetical protein
LIFARATRSGAKKARRWPVQRGTLFDKLLRCALGGPFARTADAGVVRTTRQTALCHAAEGDDRQVFSTAEELDFHFEPRAGPAAGQCPGLGAR